MSDNDNDGGNGPVELSPQNISENLDHKRRMTTILPLLQGFIAKLDTAVQEAAARGAPVDHAALAVEYTLWRDAAIASIMVHWNKFEQGLTPAQREELLPHAAEDYAEEILRPSEFEAVKEYLAQVQPPKTVRQGEELYEALEKVRLSAPAIDTSNVTSFAQRTIKKSGSDLPDH